MSKTHNSTKQLGSVGKIIPLVLIALLVFFSNACESQAKDPFKEPVQLKIASFKMGTCWYIYGVILEDFLHKSFAPGSTVDTPPGGGGTATNPLLVSRGKSDIGFGFSVVSIWAREGRLFYKKPINNLRGLVGGFGKYYLGVVANAPNTPPTIEEYIKGKDIDVFMFKKGRYKALAKFDCASNAWKEQLIGVPLHEGAVQ